MKTTLYLFLVFLAITGCGREDEEALLPKFSTGTDYIKTGIACGLCDGTCNDTLLITADKLFYKKIVWGEGEPKTEIIEQSFTRQGWENLTGLVELQRFAALELESCARCYDGCDISLEIKTSGLNNSISFPWNDYPVEVDSLVKSLDAIREHLNSL